MPRRYNPITKSGYLVTIENIPVYWETFSGVDEQSQVGEYSDGFQRDLLPLVGPASLQPYTLTRGYDPEQDDDIVEFWKTSRGSRRNEVSRTVVIQPIEYVPEPVAIGTPIILFNFKATRFTFGEVDKTSQEVSGMTLEGVGTYWDKRATNTPINL